MERGWSDGRREKVEREEGEREGEVSWGNIPQTLRATGGLDQIGRKVLSRFAGEAGRG